MSNAAMTAVPRIEPVDHRDAGVAARLHAVLMAAHAQEADLVQSGPVVPMELTAHDIQAGSECYLGAFDGPELVGTVSLAPDDEPGQVLVASLVVHPSHQRRGIARALMGKALEMRAGQVLAVVTTAANAPALGLYRALGFVAYRYGLLGTGALAVVKLRCPSRAGKAPGGAAG